ncbi:MAG: Na+/H+ antiporter NhaC family protein, partial [Lachnospiraceae bacterium]|nr:Na+/H+ antiporter NhaC family protein [Lachnospiraceae bacterium]
LGIGCLVGAMDIATANNTVAIILANPIAKDIAEENGISPKKTASLLDTVSCVFQGILPYGAQMLMALSAVITAGYMISAFDVIPYMYYPFLLLISVLVFIFVIDKIKDRKNKTEKKSE